MGFWNRVVLVALLIGVSLGGLAWAGAQGPKPKLPAPANVLCPVVDGFAVVSWDLVPGAAGYQVEAVGILADGTTTEDSEFVTDPPVSVAVDEFASLTVHVRALPGPKHPGGPLQGGGPKGEWSDPCEVVLP